MSKKQTDTGQRKTRGSQPAFDFKTKCFFCEQVVTARGKQTKSASEVLSKNREIDTRVTEAITSHSFDEWALIILGRLEGIHDLHAEDDMYPHSCYTNFVSKKNIPLRCQASGAEGKKRKRGRPKDEVLDDIYYEICRTMQEMEKNDEQVTVPTFAKQMAELALARDLDAYDARYLKKRIEDDFQGQIVITNVNGNPDVITFTSTASKILQDFQKIKSSADVEVEKMRMIKAAADIIRNDVKQQDSNLMFYPTVEDIENSSHLAPPTLLHFLENLIPCKVSSLKISSIAQAIIQNVRPRSIITPVQLSLTVILHRHFESRYLIDILHKFGLCASYSEVLRFESCAAQQQGTDLHDTDNDSFLHFVTDNVGPNSDTIDGLNTFHGMGIIACVTNPRKRVQSLPAIKRAKISSRDIVETARIEKKFFNFSQDIKPLKMFKSCIAMLG